MINVIKRAGKAGMTWQALFVMFADQSEDEVSSQVAGLIKSKLAHEVGGVIYTGPAPKHPGQSTKRDKPACRVKSSRQLKQPDGRRLEIHLPDSASLRLTALAESWGCSQSQAVERLIMESIDHYRDILLPAMGNGTIVS